MFMCSDNLQQVFCNKFYFHCILNRFAGEYSALCFSGAISFADGVKLTQIRGEAMQEASDSTPSAMVAIVGLSLDLIQRICDDVAATLPDEHLTIANYLAEANYVISGSRLACEQAALKAKDLNAKTILKLPVSGAFHSKYMSSAVPKLREALQQTTFGCMRVPVISNVTGEAHDPSDPNKIRQLLEYQLVRPVQWEITMRNLLLSPEFEKCYEIGPGNVCKGIVLRFGRRLPVVSVDCS